LFQSAKESKSRLPESCLTIGLGFSICAMNLDLTAANHPQKAQRAKSLKRVITAAFFYRRPAA